MKLLHNATQAFTMSRGNSGNSQCSISGRFHILSSLFWGHITLYMSCITVTIVYRKIDYDYISIISIDYALRQRQVKFTKRLRINS